MTNSEKSPPEVVALSFATNIQPLFRAKDINAMKSIARFDLSLYTDVATRADDILDHLAGGSMPCDGAWPTDRVELFRRWISEGKRP